MRQAEYVCPWWLIRAFDNPVRRLFQNPEAILAGLIAPGQTAVDIGCGIGYFTLALARLVGEHGLVFAVDLQSHMLNGLQRRAERQGLSKRIRLHQCTPDSLGLSEPVDFILAFWMVHEVPDRARLFREIRSLLKPQARLLFVEPKMHVGGDQFAQSVAFANQAGLREAGEPRIRLSRSRLFIPA